jgi:hypothetical protein
VLCTVKGNQRRINGLVTRRQIYGYLVSAE